MNLPLNIDLQQILLHALNFVILFGGLYFILYKPVKKFMASREQRYADRDAEATRKLEEAEAAKAGYEQKLKDAENEIAALKAEAADKAAKAAAESRKNAEAEADSIRNSARVEAEAEKQRILREAGKELSDIAAAAAEKAVFGSTEEAFDSFLNSAEKEQ